MKDVCHLNHANMEYRLQLELWRGNVAGAVQIARERNEISDWIVAMAPLASNDLWELVSCEYADQLEEDGQYHKAVTYLLAASKVHQAIDLLRRHQLFQEAITLTRLRLSPVDPVLEDLYTEWGQNLMKDGHFQLAAKCYLDMRHIQEAEKVLSHDQLFVKSLNYTPPSVYESQHRGLVYAYRTLTQHLVVGEWQKAYRFIEGHDSLKILLPILSTHELLVQQLNALRISLTLTHKPVTPEMFSWWEKKEVPKSKTGFPEFLLDKSDVDPVVPWEAFLIGVHTFPHHLLRVWHQHLGVTVVTQELRNMYASLTQLVSQKQNTDDLPTTLVRVSMDVTLCLLTLLMSETSSAINHFLHAMSTLHQGDHKLLLQALCRLMLPQGTKYMLKLQQEFNACRVLITMESHGDVNKAGGESHNSIKKFLTDIKDDMTISTSSLRCRELDCLRAYYYLAVLNFFRDNLSGAQNENDSHDGMPNRKVISGDQSITDTFCDGQKNSPITDVSQNILDHEPAKDIVKQHSTLFKHNDSKVNIEITKIDLQDSSSDWNTLGVRQNGKVSFSDSTLLLPQLSRQALIDDRDLCLVSCHPQSKDIDVSSANNNSPSITITSDASTKNSLTPLYELRSSLASSNSEFSISKTSLDSSSNVDPLFVPSKLPLLTILPLRKAVSGSCTLQAKPSMSSPSNLQSCLSWPSCTSLLLSNSSKPVLSITSPSKMLLSPSSPSSLSWASYSLSSLSSTSNSLLFLSPSTNSPSPPSLKNATESSEKHHGCVSKSQNSSSELRASPTQLTICKIHLSYVNLLRLSKGILWDVQAKREVLTETLGYIHYANSQFLLKKSLNGNQQSGSDLSDTNSKKMPVNYRQNNSMKSELEEDGGFNTAWSLSSLVPPGSQATSETPKKKSSNSIKTSKTKDHSSSIVEAARLPFQQDEDDLPQCHVEDISDNNPCNKALSCQTSRLEHSAALKAEQDLLSPLANDPTAFQKSRKVLWIDGKETCTDVGSGISMSTSQVSRQAPDGSVIPEEWDDLPVDVKYSLPYVSLSLLKQEEQIISQELKRVPDMSKIPFPSIRASIKSLLLTSLTSPHLSVKEKISYFKQLKDWATLFSVTAQQQDETETMFTTAAKEYLT